MSYEDVKEVWTGKGDVSSDWDLRYLHDAGIAVIGQSKRLDDNFFWESGKIIHYVLDRCNIKTQGLDVAEYGCGPGRLISLLDCYKKTGYDASEVALKYGSDRFKDINFIKINNPNNPDIKEHDFIYTYLVLQHNTKDVAMNIAKKMIEKSKKFCLIDFPTQVAEKKHDQVSTNNTWDSRGYEICDLYKEFPNAEYYMVGDYSRYFLVFKK